MSHNPATDHFLKRFMRGGPTERELEHDQAVTEAIQHVQLPPEHAHDLAAIDVYHPRRVPMQPETTVVLFGCKTCEWVETSTLDGTWSTEQITRLHARPDGSLEDSGPYDETVILDLLHRAWGLISSADWDAGNGDADLRKNPDWHEAVTKWRDEFYAIVDPPTGVGDMSKYNPAGNDRFA